MKLVLLTWLFGSLVVATVGNKQKAISFFSVVSFPNDECPLKTDTVSKGICMTSSECSEAGGRMDGNCASGFGTCCFLFFDQTGGEISRNLTHVINPGYPSGYSTTSKTFKYTIKPFREGICQIRLDFDHFELNSPPSTGACSSTDQLTIAQASKGKSVGTLCGTLTGQHIYMETGQSDPAGSFTITTGTDTFTRKWKIKVAQIECEAVHRAPHDCVQYLTGKGGQFTSFNHPNFIPRGSMYTICIRREENHCGIQFNTYQIGTNEDFRLDPSPTAAITNSKRTSTASCDEANIVIGQPGAVSDVFCGRTFSNLVDNTQDGSVYSHVNPFTVNVAIFNDDQRSAVGFSLQYHQLPCGEHQKK